MFTDEILTFAENTMHNVSSDLDVELVEFNGETDHVHLLVAYLPTMAISTLVQRLNGRTAYAVRDTNSSAAASVPACAATPGRRPTSLSPAEAHHCPSSSNTSSDKHTPLTPGHPRPGWANAGLKSEACAQESLRSSQ